MMDVSASGTADVVDHHLDVKMVNAIPEDAPAAAIVTTTEGDLSSQRSRELC